MSKKIVNLKSLPSLETVHCGPLTVAWLPPEAAVPEDFIARSLDPGEAAYAATLRHPARRDEYRRSRYLIRALSQCSDPLPRRPEGDPTWPAGFVGSLTHKDGFVGVALEPAGAYRSVGVDAELVEKLKAAFEPRLASDAESRLLDARAEASGMPRQQLLALLFSFKEALFKAHFPIGRRMFYFLDAELTRITGHEIAARVLIPTSPYTPAGHVTYGHYVLKETSRGLMAVSAATLPF